MGDETVGCYSPLSEWVKWVQGLVGSQIQAPGLPPQNRLVPRLVDRFRDQVVEEASNGSRFHLNLSYASRNSV